MKRVLAILCLAAALISVPAVAQIDYAFHHGRVWLITYIRTKPGANAKYMKYLANEWKPQHEALKKAGLILDYKVVATEAHSPQDFDLMLITEYKDLATMEANASKIEMMTHHMLGGEDKIADDYKDRDSWREILGERIAREVVLGTPDGNPQDKKPGTTKPPAH